MPDMSCDCPHLYPFYTGFLACWTWLGAVRGVWGSSIIGGVFKSLMTHKLVFLAPVLYIALGWLITGGLSYTFGIIFYALDRIPFNHAIWYLFVYRRQPLPLFCDSLVCGATALIYSNSSSAFSQSSKRSLALREIIR